MRVLVCGGRYYGTKLVDERLDGQEERVLDWDLINKSVDYIKSLDPTVIIQGGAKGADGIGKYTAKVMGIPCEEYKAKWREFGNKAGPIRNQQMIDEGKPDLVVAFPGTQGTANMVSLAKKAGIEVIDLRKRT